MQSPVLKGSFTIKSVHAVTCIKRLHFSCPVIENFIWIELRTCTELPCPSTKDRLIQAIPETQQKKPSTSWILWRLKRFIAKYSQICNKRSHLGQRKSGQNLSILCTQSCMNLAMELDQVRFIWAIITVYSLKSYKNKSYLYHSVQS
jgi:hypothetical protein